MALNPLAIYAVLPGGNASNGGGFDNTVPSPGTDFSQQNSPQVTYTDLVIGASNTVTSVAHPFSSIYPGNYIHITGGTGFTQGWYRVHTVSGSTATLDRSPGTNGSTGGGGKLGGAFASPADVNQFLGSTGGIVWCVGTTFTIGGSSVAVTAGGSDNAPLVFIGNGAARSDGTPALFTCNATDPGIALDFQSSFTLVRGFKLDGNSIAGTGINLNQINSAIANSWVLNCNSINLKLNNFNLTAFRCRTSGLKAGTTGSGGFFVTGGCRLLYCESDNNIGNGFASSNQPYDCNRCVAFNNTKSGFYTFGAGGMWLDNCVADHNTLDGARWDATNVLGPSFVINCAFTSNSGFGMRSNTTDYSGDTYEGLFRFWNNAFWNNTSGAKSQLPNGNNEFTLTADPWTASDNFKPNNTAGGGAVLKAAGIAQLGTLDDPRPTSSVLDVGVAQSPASTAPSAPTTLTASVIGGGAVSLAWVNVATNASSINIERAVGAGLFSVLATVGASVTAYIDTTTAAGVQYSYRVNAINAGGASGYTNTVTVVIPNAVPTSAAPVIDEVQFPTDNSEGTSGGPSFSTIVTTASTGFETRVPMWRVGKYKFTVIYSLKSPAKMIPVVAFFIARAGKSRGFRFKDWSDFQATNEPLTVTGSKFVQLIKTYSSGSISYVRNIYKPQTNLTPTTLKRNNVSYTTFTLDTTTGLVTLTADSTKNITGITQAAQAVVTATAHGFSNGDYIYFENVQGMTQINGLVGVIQSSTTNTFTVNIDSTGFNAYSAGGLAEKFIQPSETLNWSGEFDVPVRFDVDEMDVVQTASEIRDWTSVPLVEVLN